MSSKARQRQGIDAAKARGLYRGRKKGAIKKGIVPGDARRLAAAGMTQQKIAQRLGVSVSTVRRYLRKKEIEVPSRKLLVDLGIEIDGDFISARSSIHALRALLSIYRIASSYPESIRQLLNEIENESEQFKSFRDLLGVMIEGPDFDLLRAKPKLPPRPPRSLKGVSEDDFFRIVQWASETPKLAQEVIARTEQPNGIKIEVLLSFAQSDTRSL